jgi:hypothetical protein
MLLVLGLVLFGVADARGQSPQGPEPRGSPEAPQSAPEGGSESPGDKDEQGSGASAEGAQETAEPADTLFGGPDLGPLQGEFTKLMDDLVQARSRVAMLGRQLFETKVRIRIDNEADGQSLQRVALRLDGAPVFRSDGAELSPDADVQQVFEGFAAPGPHVVEVEVEQRARANDTYRYTLRDGFRFEVRRGKRTDILVVLEDDSEIAEDFPDDGEGSYEVHTEVRVATRELED